MMENLFRFSPIASSSFFIIQKWGEEKRADGKLPFGVFPQPLGGYAPLSLRAIHPFRFKKDIDKAVQVLPLLINDKPIALFWDYDRVNASNASILSTSDGNQP